MRNVQYDWTRPVDGSIRDTEWNGVHSVASSPNVINPQVGWVYNTNNYPWSAADINSPRKEVYQGYFDAGTVNARGVLGIMVLKDRKDFTLDKLLSAAYDSYLTWFTEKLPALVKAWDLAPASDSLKPKLAGQIEILRSWDLRWDTTSVATSLAVFWGDEVSRRVAADARRAGVSTDEFIALASANHLLGALSTASDKLTADFGTWQTPWGNINRFQRLTGDIAHPFSDSGPSIPVGFTSARWGSLASFGARAHPGTKKWYGTSGNSFVAVVEFGDSLRARAVTAGGESGDPASRHFNDQAERYSTGNLREVYFYRSQLKGHTERTYRPGR
jgi:acyl-homoserine lactone acylase PvdQ